jgi:sulfur carrier protein
MAVFNLVSVRIDVVYEGKKKSVMLRKDARIDDLLEKLEINRETVLVRLNSKVCVEEEALREGDEVEIVKAISGG